MCAPAELLVEHDQRLGVKCNVCRHLDTCSSEGTGAGDTNT